MQIIDFLINYDAESKKFISCTSGKYLGMTILFGLHYQWYSIIFQVVANPEETFVA